MTQQSTRALALARRKALSGAGKTADKSAASERTRSQSMQRKAAPVDPAALVAARGAQAGSPAVAPAPMSSPAPRRAASAPAATNTSRAKALARRKAMSTSGKKADSSTDRTSAGRRNTPVDAAASSTASASAAQAMGKTGDCGCGCNGAGDCNDNLNKPTSSAIGSRRNGSAKMRVGKGRNLAASNPSKAASMARRQAQSSRGKAGIGVNGMSAAQTARAGNPDLSSRELAKALREQRSQRGGAGLKKAAPTGRVRPNRNNGQGPVQGAATDAPWKVGITETSRGQAVTGTMVGRSRDMTGDEASTCRTVTGTEYMGADVFRDFCQAEPSRSFSDMGLSKTSRGNSVTGNKVGRSQKVTGDEPGSCKNVTGTEYLGAGQLAACGNEPAKSPAKVTKAETRGGKSVTGNNVGRSGRVTGDEVGADRQLTGTQYMQRDTTKDRPGAPAKVGASATLRGGAVTGTMVGRHKSMTGDEAGSCRNVTGDDYIGQEQFGSFCESTPAPKDQKVGVSATLSGERVTGTMTGRASKVTGDEPGTCKSITGTPYAGSEQYGAFCEPDQAKAAAARMQPSKRMFGSVMTGIQPAVGGTMTGDAKGACEAVSGTPYVGADQVAAVCASMPAEMSAPDFPQPLNGQGWGQFSVAAPAHAAEAPRRVSNVTGAMSDGGNITGPFGMAGGKVTGTDDMRFGRNKANPVEMAAPSAAPMIDGRVKSRVTGEGQSSGLKVTGDDWDRGDRVTGTEGMSATVRNPSRRGPQQPMASAMAQGRPEATPQPVSKVTGASGNYEGGSLITFSGGARG